MKKQLLLLFLLVLSSSVGATNLPPVVQLKPGMVNDSIKHHAVILPDKGKTLTGEEALHLLEAGAFLPYDQLEIPSKFRRGSYKFWIFFSVQNTGTATFPLLCQHPSMGYDSVFVVKNGGFFTAFRTAFPAGRDTTGLLQMPMYGSFLYEVPPHSEVSFLIAMDDYAYRLYFLPGLSDATFFEDWMTRETLLKTSLYLIAVGLILTIIILFGLQYLHTGDRVDLWYMLYGLVMLIIAWRNLESINHHYISTFFLISWTKSKIFLSAGIFITYTFFIRYFFGAGTPVLKKIAHFTLLVCCAAMIMEVILLQINWYWSWLLYYWFRIAASLFSLVFLFIIWKSPHPLAKFVFSGSLCLIVAEIISWFVPTAITSEVAWAGVVLEFIFFSYAMGMRTQLERQEKLRLAFANELLTVEKALETERLRTRIAQDIHDEVGASLTKIALTAQVAERITRGDENITRQHLRRISEHARLAAGQLRDIVFGINPDYDSFSEMLTYFQERIHHFWEDQSLHYHIDFPSTENNPTVSPKVKRQLLLILKEAMTNISRHADASEVHIRLVLKNADNYLLEIRDNGQGFSPGSAHHFSNGLSGMQKRADAIQAKLWIDTAPGEGCRITIEGQLDAV